MTQQSPIRPMPGTADAGREVAQLRHVLALVEQLAGRVPANQEPALDDAARIGAAYADAAPVVQKRFDALASETATWAAAGIEALLDGSEATLAAAALADELAGALRRLAAILDPAMPAPEADCALPSWLCRP